MGGDGTRGSRRERSKPNARVGVLVAVGVATLAAGCGGGTGARLLKGSGATFPNNFYQAAIQVYQADRPDITITYDAKGSGAGQTDLQGNLVQWAGSDDPVDDEDLPKFRGEFLYFPTVAAPITVAYNVAGLPKLALSPETLAKLFTRAVTAWNDPAIAADNPGVALPSTKVTVVHRSDSSGTTANFTEFLARAAPAVWTGGSSKAPSWAAGTVGAEANAGVANAVKQADGAIGYVDYAAAVASKLAFAAIENRSGEYVAPSLEAAQKAVAGATPQPNLLYDPIDSSAAGAYPIVAPTWVLVYRHQPDQQTVDDLKGWLTFLLSEGQRAASTVDFAALPPALAQQAIDQLDRITVGGA